MSDVEAYRALLRPIEDEARSQAWDRERPWRVATHVHAEAELPVVDLHDLKAGPARRAVLLVLTSPPVAGGVVFVVGRGRHTLGAVPVLKKVVEKELRKACAVEADWLYRPAGPARWLWVTDREKVLGSSGCLAQLASLWWVLLLLGLLALGVYGKAVGWDR